MNDVQSILEEMLPFVETLLKEYGEFYLVSAVVIRKNLLNSLQL